MDIVVFSFCDITLFAPKPLSSLHPTDCTSLGDHIRSIRLHQNLYQREVAKELGVETTTLENWEKNRSHPRPRYHAKIIEFLGYTPEVLKESRSWGEILLYYRTSKKISQKELAEMIGIEVRILRKLERGGEGYFFRTQEKIISFLKTIREEND